MKYSLLFVLISQLVLAQNQPFYKSYNWDLEPTYPESGFDKNEDVVGLKNKIVSEFYFTDSNSLVEYYLEHEVIYINSDDKIEEYNRVYLPYSNRREVIVNKARVINSDGTVVEADPKKVLEAEDEESGRKYQYFAVEGLEKGSVFERLYVYQRYPEYNGRFLRLQEKYPKYNVSFSLYSPDFLEFKFNSYNGLPVFELQEQVGQKSHWKVEVAEMPELKVEDGASFNNNAQHTIYKLYKNLNNNKSDFVDYSQVAKNIYERYYDEPSKRARKRLQKLLNDEVSGADDDEKLRNLDAYIKNNFYKSDRRDEEFSDLEEVLKNKVANESGLLKLYVAALNQMGVKHEIVLTSERDDIPMDPDFDAYNFLQEYLIYFPDQKLFTEPTSLSQRYGFPRALLTDTYGLFIKEVSMGNFKSSVGQVKYIPARDAKESVDVMDIGYNFNTSDPSTANIDMRFELTGYNAAFLQPFIAKADSEIRDNILTSYVERITENLDMKSKDFQNIDPNDFGDKPLIMNYNFESSDFVDKAGPRLLFKIGKLIGAQTEMYNEEGARSQLFHGAFNRTYNRTITVELPDGYEVANLDDINIYNVGQNDSGQVVFYFKSDYEIKEGKLIVRANEFYNQAVVAPEQYEDYRTVINSAADFEKVTLILKKSS